MSETCPNCERLEKRVTELEAQVKSLLDVVNTQKKRIEELESELKKGRRQAHPFGKGSRKKKPKKPGRRAGEGNFNYRKPPTKVDYQVFTKLTCCPDCGEELSDKKSHVNWQSDLPKVKVEVTEYHSESGWCGQCQQRKRSVANDQLVTGSGASASGIGPRLLALSVKLKHEDGLSYRRIRDLVKTLTEESLTTGAFSQGSQRLAKRLESDYDELVDLLREASVVHGDETGWRIGTLSAWLWVFTNAEATVYTIEPNRGHEVIVEILGEDFEGVLHSDRAKAYDHKKLSHWLKQKCISHIIRNLSTLESQQQGGAVHFARQVKTLLRQALKLEKKRFRLEPFKYAKQCQYLETKLDKLLSETRQWRNLDNQKMAKNLRKHRPNLLRFLYSQEVEATNNRAERALRPAVIVRKTGRCNKSSKGAKAHAIIASVVSTLRQHGLNTLEGLTQLIGSNSLSLTQLIAPT